MHSRREEPQNNGRLDGYCTWRVCRVNVNLTGPALWGATAYGFVARYCTHAMHVRCESARAPLCVPWPPPDARPPLQNPTFCALMPPPIRKRGRASAIYLVSGGTSWNDRLIFFGWDARQLELISPDAARQPNHCVAINAKRSSRIKPCVGMWRQNNALRPK